MLELHNVELSTGDGVAAAGPKEGEEKEDREGPCKVAVGKRDREVVCEVDGRVERVPPPPTTAPSLPTTTGEEDSVPPPTFNPADTV